MLKVCVQACGFICVSGCVTVWKCRYTIEYECGSVLRIHVSASVWDTLRLGEQFNLWRCEGFV